jgi:hypothetical protein
MQQRVLRTDQIKVIQEALSGFLMDQVILVDPNGKYYYDRKEILPSSHKAKNLG